MPDVKLLFGVPNKLLQNIAATKIPVGYHGEVTQLLDPNVPGLFIVTFEQLLTVSDDLMA